MYLPLCLCFAAVMGSAAGSPLDFDAGPRMNQIQVLGTHNSYHRLPLNLDLAVRITADAVTWNYEHAPLDVQLARQVRSFELDIHYTAEGWRVFHVPVLDDQSTCRIFIDCLTTVKAWSDAHPDHVPISFLIEHKEEGPLLDSAIFPPDAAALDRLDRDIRAVFPPERLITPDAVRGDFETLEEALLKRGWPTLDSARGKVFFIFHEIGELRDLYLRDHPLLQGRAMFVRSEPGHPYAATLVCDNPGDPAIPGWVKQGYWVRTTAGNPMHEGLERAKRRRDEALACGAQIVSSDFPPGEPHRETGYRVTFPAGVTVRWNPLIPPADTRETPEKEE